MSQRISHLFLKQFEDFLPGYIKCKMVSLNYMGLIWPGNTTPKSPSPRNKFSNHQSSRNKIANHQSPAGNKHPNHHRN